MPDCKLVVKDAVNVKFEDVSPSVRRRMAEALKFMVPNARHTPQYKLGRWDGTVSFCSAGGATYLNLLDRLIPILYEENYEIEIEDHRQSYEFVFPEISETMFSHKSWPEGHVKAGEPITLIENDWDELSGDAALSVATTVTRTGPGACDEVGVHVNRPLVRSIATPAGGLAPRL